MSIPAGWQLVPIDLTPEMHNAYDGAVAAAARAEGISGKYRVTQKQERELRWKAMLEAAPKPPC